MILEEISNGLSENATREPRPQQLEGYSSATTAGQG
jgi:hypothetical protein